MLIVVAPILAPTPSKDKGGVRNLRHLSHVRAVCHSACALTLNIITLGPCTLLNGKRETTEVSDGLRWTCEYQVVPNKKR